MTMLDIQAPAEQEGTRSQILRWLKAPGDAVNENEPLVELETDKVTVEVAAPASGVLKEIFKGEREEIEPGEILGRMQSGVSARKMEATHSVSSVRNASSPSPSNVKSSRSTTPLSPAVRRLLAEKGLEAADVSGSGEGGRVTVQDILSHQSDVKTRANLNPAPRATSGFRLVPHSAARTRIAAHMVQSLLQTAPHVTTVFEADLSAVIRHRDRHRQQLETQGGSLTFTAYFIKAAVAAIRAVPEANSRWTETALEIYDRIDIGVATALEGGGLIVPVLRDAHEMDLFETARTLHTLIASARSGNLEPAQTRNGTFTISNHGVSGSLLAAPIVINQPQSAILGIGKLEKRPIVDANDVVVVQPRCYVTLTIDHRVMDGLQANRFLQTFVDTLQTAFG